MFEIFQCLSFVSDLPYYLNYSVSFLLFEDYFLNVSIALFQFEFTLGQFPMITLSLKLLFNVFQ